MLGRIRAEGDLSALDFEPEHGAPKDWFGMPEPAPSVAFVAPFDSLLWDNALVANPFGFKCVWEGFFPPAKRRWG